MRLRIGTRRSRLALAQAAEVASRLDALDVETELVPMVTSGDRGVPPESSPAGLKGLFVAEIVRALERGEVDLAVHSAKDLPSEDPPGVVVAAVPQRADPLDVLVTRGPDLAPGAVIGTSSVRRRAQLLRSARRVEVRTLRGNVDTRLRKLDDGEVDGLVLAAAGLSRLRASPRYAVSLSLDEMVPAPGQGALAVQARESDARAREVLARVDDGGARVAFEAERALVLAVGGDCSVPLGAYAEPRGEAVSLVAVVASPDGEELLRAQADGPTPADVAAEVAKDLLARGAEAILARGAGEA